MVDTLVLGTSAKAWEFESLHAQTGGYNLCYALQFCVLSETQSADLEFEQAEQSHERSERQTIMSVMNILTNWRRWRLMRGAAFLGMPFMESRSRQSLHAHHIKKRSIKPLFYCYY